MSFHENTELHIKSACLFELEQAEKEWGKTYNSLHEGWAVLKEEVGKADFDHKQILHLADEMWRIIKADENVDNTLEFVQKYAIQAMKELAQVWAVCEKMKKTAKKEE